MFFVVWFDLTLVSVILGLELNILEKILTYLIKMLGNHFQYLYRCRNPSLFNTYIVDKGILLFNLSWAMLLLLQERIAKIMNNTHNELGCFLGGVG